MDGAGAGVIVNAYKLLAPEASPASPPVSGWAEGVLFSGQLHLVLGAPAWAFFDVLSQTTLPTEHQSRIMVQCNP
jgi:hypothetical protein